jgi:hypothetical protein
MGYQVPVTSDENMLELIEYYNTDQEAHLLLIRRKYKRKLRTSLCNQGNFPRQKQRRKFPNNHLSGNLF